MPAIITHHLFGEDATTRLPEGTLSGEEELLAFLLGNQGPDPFYFCFTATPMAIQASHRMAEAMHDGNAVAALVTARDSVISLPPDDRAAGSAFALGLLAHYLLDSEGHAFVHAQQEALFAVDEELEDYRDQVHALIESELDTWMLWSTRSLTILDAPAASDLTRTDRISRAAGALFSQVAWQVFGISLGADRYEGSVADYELIYRAIDPAGNPKGRMLSGVERLSSKNARLDALAHAVVESDECAAANLACHPWVDPLDGSVRTESFADVYYAALDRWPALAEAYLHGSDAELEALMARSYGGGPREA